MQRVLAHDETQTEAEAVTEDESAFEAPDQALVRVPRDLVPAVRVMIAKHRKYLALPALGALGRYFLFSSSQARASAAVEGARARLEGGGDPDPHEQGSPWSGSLELRVERG